MQMHVLVSGTADSRPTPPRLCIFGVQQLARLDSLELWIPANNSLAAGCGAGCRDPVQLVGSVTDWLFMCTLLVHGHLQHMSSAIQINLGVIGLAGQHIVLGQCALLHYTLDAWQGGTSFGGSGVAYSESELQQVYNRTPLCMWCDCLGDSKSAIYCMWLRCLMRGM